jgi:hypothetical protein
MRVPIGALSEPIARAQVALGGGNTRKFGENDTNTSLFFAVQVCVGNANAKAKVVEDRAITVGKTHNQSVD